LDKQIYQNTINHSFNPLFIPFYFFFFSTKVIFDHSTITNKIMAYIIDSALIHGIFQGISFAISRFIPNKSSILQNISLALGVIFFNFRDFLNPLSENRSIGKQLMDLQILDANTGLPASTFQIIKRNLFYLPLQSLLLATKFELSVSPVLPLFSILLNFCDILCRLLLKENHSFGGKILF
jgi:uncharacterized RDD family membrane protein YckC